MSFVILRRSAATPFLLSTASFFSLAAVVSAQTPTSTLYSFTQIDGAANLGNNSVSDVKKSANGVFVGQGSGSNTGNEINALRWNADGSVTNLNTVANLGTTSRSSATDYANGVTVGYGAGNNTGGFNSFNALRWNADGTVTNLHTLANLGSSSYSYAFGIADGVTVGNGLGVSTGYQFSALRWNADNSVTNLGNQIAASGINLGASSFSQANRISAGVTVGYGRGSNTNNADRALRWNTDNTVTNLHTLANLGTNAESRALGVSGAVTVGYGAGSNTSSENNALRWNANGTVTNLHTAANLSGTSSVANDVAGGVVVGSMRTTSGNNNALLWNVDGSVLNLQQFVGSAAASSALSVDAATGVIVGSAANKAGYWIPLNISGGSGTNNLRVSAGYTTTITQNFTQSAGTTSINGTLNMAGNTFSLTGGTLGGNGTLTGTLTQTGGTLSAGNSPGTLTINGDYNQSGGTFLVEIAGPTQGAASGYDFVNVSGAANLGGTLQIAFSSGFVPTLGQTFDFLSYGSRNGIFTSVSGPSGYNYSVTYNATGARLTVNAVTAAPEPGSVTLSLPLLAGTGVVFVRRRKK